MHPIFFYLGGHPVRWYWVLYVCGIVAAIVMAAWRAWLEDVEISTVLDIARWLVIFGLLGGKLFYMLTDWNSFLGAFKREGFASMGQGWVFYGGFICATVGGGWYARARGIDFWRMTDFFGAAAPLGHAFGRMGCFLAGCCYGVPSSLPWAVRFPYPHPTLGVPVHPTQLYEAAGNLALFGALAWFLPRRKFNGQVFCLYMIGYAVLRFFVEFLRDDNPRRWPGALTDSQVLAMISIAVAMALLWRLRRNGRSVDIAQCPG